MSLRIRLLGRPTLERNGVHVRLEGRKTWALLALVLLESPPPTRRQLVERLWSDADDPFAATRWALSQVRKALGPEATIEERDGRLVPTGAFGLDAHDLLNGAWADDTIDDITRGELLEGLDPVDPPEFERWLGVQRARIATARVDALRSCAASLVRRDPLRALQLAERALATEPFDDAFHELVVECHLARADIARATQYVKATEELYRRELGAPAPPRLVRALERPRPVVAAPLLSLDLEARALLETARVRANAGAWDDARDITMRAINDAAASGDRALETRGILEFVAIRTCQLGRGPAEWDPLLQRAFMLASDIGDPNLLCDVEIERGRIAAIEARYGTAEASLRRGLLAARDLGDDPRAARVRRYLGMCEMDRCDYVSAESDLRAAAEHPAQRDAAMACLARLLVRIGRLDEADAVAEDCLSRMEGTDAIIWRPLAMIQSAEVRLARGDLVAASERLASALTIAKETGDVDWTILALRGFAHIDRADGRPERGLATLRSALEIASERPGCYRRFVAEILTDLVEWQKGADRAHVEQALRLALSAPMPDLAARLLSFRDSHTPLHTVAS